MIGPLAPEPIAPKPEPHTKFFLGRLLKGLHSWLGLLSDVDFQIPIGSVRFLGLNLFLVNEPKAVKQVMVDAVEDFPKHPYTLWILEPLIGRAIFSVNGAEWARQRRLVDQAFQVAQLREVLPQMQGAVDALSERLESQGDAQPGRSGVVNIDTEMTLVAADVIVRTILSRPLREAEAAIIFQAFARYQRRAGQALILRLLRLPQEWLQSYLARHARMIRSWIGDEIEARLACDHGDGARGQHTKIRNSQDLLQALIEARDPQADDLEVDGRFSSQELVDQVCFLFLAGHETSASALGMAVYLLGRFPEVQQRLRAEVLEVLGSRAGAPDRPLTFEDLRQLSYGAAIFNETLRLYPPVSFFIREARTDAELAGSRCPFRALVTVSPWVIQRHGQHWSEPNVFRPERFLPGATPEDRRWARDAFLPYGLGPRKCPGAAFAQQEALLVLAELVRRFQVLPEVDHQPELVARLTLRSRTGIKVRLVRREDGAV